MTLRDLTPFDGRLWPSDATLQIGAIGFGLDKLMGLVEARIKTA